jgi:hypothetical protein
MGRIKIAEGAKYSRLTVIGESERVYLPCGQSNRTVLCRCDCGNERVVRLMQLVRGRVTSCGCRVDNHGMSRTKLYGVWAAMKRRCYSKKHINSNRYIDRGITMCDEWKKSFSVFKDWALKNNYAHGLQIDRKDNDKGYSPENCRFVTNKVNCNNREVTLLVDYNGQRTPLTLTLDSLRLGAHYHAIFRRIQRGWDHQKAIDTPIRTGNYRRNPCHSA